MINNLLALAHISHFTTKTESLIKDPAKTRTLYLTPNQEIFLVVHKNTIELRTDLKLSHLLQSKYETVMQSRYFGKGGIEIVLSPQIKSSDLADLIRLSYDLTKSK